jgi:hypothetical protein
MISLHHTHLMASDPDATIAFWRDGFGGDVVHDRAEPTTALAETVVSPVRVRVSPSFELQRQRSSSCFRGAEARSAGADLPGTWKMYADAPDGVLFRH